MDRAAADNSEQVEYWNGDVGRKWAQNQERLDRAFRPLTAALIERVAPRPGQRAVDIGCGCGEVSLALARDFGAAGHVLAVDVSRPMLEHAKARLGERGQAAIEWQEADAGTAPFEGGFDLLVSRFGLMFFADPVEAFRNLRRALRPRGRLMMLCWRPLQDNPWVAVPRAAMLQVVPAPDPMPPDAPGPFAFGDAARVGAILARAGFVDVSSMGVDAALELSEGGGDAALEAAVRFVTEVGPAAALLRDVGEEVRGRALAAVREALHERARKGRALLDAGCWIYTA